MLRAIGSSAPERSSFKPTYVSCPAAELDYIEDVLAPILESLDVAPTFLLVLPVVNLLAAVAGLVDLVADVADPLVSGSIRSMNG